MVIMKEQYDVIIIGAGACGLMAARELGKAGKTVLLLEARDRTGGRIHTLDIGEFSMPVDSGAEFIHGDLPVTKRLLDEAGLHYELIGGELWRTERGMLAQEDSFTEGADIVIPRLETLETDITIAAFFKKFFDDHLYENLVSEIRGYVEGYDAGDINRASAFALRDEWGGGEEGNQYRPVNGYKPMISFLEAEIVKYSGKIQLNTLVKKITWNEQAVTAHTDVSEFQAQQLIVTIPLGILQNENSHAGIMIPELPLAYRDALQQLGYGSAIKIVFEFNTEVWEDAIVDSAEGKNLENLGWLFSNEEIPTWWTQAPKHIPMITGWLAGPKANALKSTPDAEIIERGLSSLARILKLDISMLKEKLVASAVFNWTADPFTAGAYAYSTPETKKALEVFRNPVDGRVFFAGEAFHDGPQMGTVEGAIVSGVERARWVLGEKTINVQKKNIQ